MVLVNDKCIGCGICESEASSIFKVEDWFSHVIKQPMTPEEHQQVDTAITSCPVVAIEK
jgi:ferredoxin